MSNWKNMLGLMNRACASTFGGEILYTPSVGNRPELGGRPVAVTGIFSEPLDEIAIMSGGSDGIDTVVRRPQVELQPSALGFTPLEGDEVAANGKTYRILEVQVDGFGATAKLFLRQV